MRYILLLLISGHLMAQKPLNVPVTLLSYTVVVNNHPILKWETAQEINNDHFTIERSTDGFIYNTIATIEGSGTIKSTTHYQYEDIDEVGGDIFYRLRQTDYDGHTEILGIKRIHLNWQMVNNFKIEGEPTSIKYYTLNGTPTDGAQGAVIMVVMTDVRKYTFKVYHK